MIKEAIEYIVNMSAPHLTEVDGETYSDRPLDRVSYAPTAATLRLDTLTSLVDYIKGCKKDMYEEYDQQWIIHINDPAHVYLMSMLDTDRKRETLIEASSERYMNAIGNYIDQESFLIGIKSNFVQTDNTALLLKFAGTVEDKSVAQYTDDGITQKATIKRGIAGHEEAVVPSPIALAPYRTFLEVEQPESDFVFRMKTDERGIRCALFEADGGAWKHEAINNIKAYLSEALKDEKNIIIIA